MYTFKNTEINNKKASDFETKSLLYLLGMRNDSEEIEIITVDCFNDVTGSNTDFSKLWDVQSKNHSSLPPSKIGESLSTLYDNYISSINFNEYILFIPKLNREYLVDSSLNIYSYENINEKQKKGIEKKLKENINGDKSGSTPPLFLDFLSKLCFVEDNKRVSTYIKKMSRFKNKKSIPEEVYDRIFVEIRNAQASLKNSYIENEKINHPSEVLRFNRHITKTEINTLLISRLVGIDVFSFPGIPFSFFDVLIGKDEEERKDLLQECNENLSRAFFDKNGCREFWEATEKLMNILKDKPDDSVFDVYSNLTSVVNVKTEYLTKETLLYMISLVKAGLADAN
ncbi:Uncharacterised protein [Zhongshania aliphaticivorans]|uniref:CD-NTase associated protein 4-like DNA endonuclease domain-containing protein n=1 Tax=Zhongshania aliphaticivorans TaxID=1470434 RepID=A0A5S9N6Z4_9GAMM|nr:hypothetical protein [Zhongshania aliphaticivorans]CAA0080554.1 Uncharacterised protein [Zhongshania aliphaticivorans]CAA0085681.1 Uncharacterised protein [Zhongshania aliphaticivorans]